MSKLLDEYEKEIDNLARANKARDKDGVDAAMKAANVIWQKLDKDERYKAMLL